MRVPHVRDRPVYAESGRWCPWRILCAVVTVAVLAPGTYQVAREDLMALMIVLPSLGLLGLVYAHMRPFRIRVEADCLRLGGVLPPAPTRIALADVRWAAATRGYRVVTFGAFCLGRARWDIASKVIYYGQGIEGHWGDRLPARSGVCLHMRSGMWLYVESRDPDALARALWSCGVASQPE